MDIENLLELKLRLSQSDPPDPVVQSNLKFAIAAMEALPVVMKTNSELLVEGEQTLIRITAGQPQRSFTVFEDNEGRKLHQKARFNRALNIDDIDMAYFIGHCCPHTTPCRQQAINALFVSSNVEIKVICKELRLTLTPARPEKTIMLPPTAPNM